VAVSGNRTPYGRKNAETEKKPKSTRRDRRKETDPFARVLVPVTQVMREGAAKHPENASVTDTRPSPDPR
jgi:hypothetical protein